MGLAVATAAAWAVLPHLDMMTAAPAAFLPAWSVMMAAMMLRSVASRAMGCAAKALPGGRWPSRVAGGGLGVGALVMLAGGGESVVAATERATTWAWKGTLLIAWTCDCGCPWSSAGPPSRGKWEGGWMW